MSDLTIITNNVPRDILEGWDLSPSEREHFDYIDWAAVERGEESCSFVRYRGELYDLGDTEGRPPAVLAGWDAYLSDSFFSGVVFRYARDDSGDLDPERVIVGRYYC